MKFINDVLDNFSPFLSPNLFPFLSLCSFQLIIWKRNSHIRIKTEMTLMRTQNFKKSEKLIKYVILSNIFLIFFDL